MILYDERNNKIKADKCRQPSLTWYSKHHHTRVEKTIDLKTYTFWKFTSNYYFEYRDNWYKIKIPTTKDRESNSYFTEIMHEKDRKVLRIETLYGTDLSDVDFNIAAIAVRSFLEGLEWHKNQNKTIDSFVKKPSMDRAARLIEEIPELSFIFGECQPRGVFTKTNIMDGNQQILNHLLTRSDECLEIAIKNINKYNLIEILSELFQSTYNQIEMAKGEDHTTLFTPEYSPKRSFKIVLDILLFVFPYMNYKILEDYKNLRKGGRIFFQKAFLFYFGICCKVRGINDFLASETINSRNDLYDRRIRDVRPFKILQKKQIRDSGLTRAISLSLFRCYYNHQHYMMNVSYDIVKNNENIIVKIVNNIIREVHENAHDNR